MEPAAQRADLRVVLAVAYGATFLYGLAAAGNDDINFLSINGADNVLHLLSAVAGLAIATGPVPSLGLDIE